MSLRFTAPRGDAAFSAIQMLDAMCGSQVMSGEDDFSIRPGRIRSLSAQRARPFIAPPAQAARAKAGERYDAFVTVLGRRLAKGPKLRQEIAEDAALEE